MVLDQSVKSFENNVGFVDTLSLGLNGQSSLGGDGILSVPLMNAFDFTNVRLIDAGSAV